MTPSTITITVLIIVVIVLIVLLFARKPHDYMQSFALLQQRIGEIEEQVKKSVSEGNNVVSEKFENSLKVIGAIRETLGGLAETNKQMLDISKNISSLQDLLRPPQIRGSLGELTLGNILAQLLPKEYYREQHRFKNGVIVDAAVSIGEKWVPIDSKFPLDDFQRYHECQEESAKKTLLRKFERNVKDKVDEIAAKYILSDEGTYDFALMYIPSENVYYQTIIKDDMQINDKSIAEYAIQKRVVVVSPNSIYAYLHVICFGLRGMQVEKNVRKIMDNFDRLNREFDKFATEFDKLGTHLTHASDTFSRADKQLEKFSSRLTLISETTESGEAKALEEPTQ